MAASGHRRRLRRKRKIHYVFCSLLTKAAAGGGFPGSIFGRFSTSRERPGPKTQGPWAHRHPFQNCTRKNPHPQAEPEQVQTRTVHSAWSIFGCTTHHFRPRSESCSQWAGVKSTPDCRLGPTTKLVEFKLPVIPGPRLTTLRLADCSCCRGLPNSTLSH